MAAGITFRIGGAIDPSYRGALAQSVVEAQTAAGKIAKAEVEAFRVAANVAVRSESETYSAVARSAKVLETKIATLQAAGAETLVYRDALLVLQTELHHVAVAEKLAGDAAIDRARKNFIASERVGPQSVHDAEYIQRKAQYEALFGGQGKSYYDEASIAASIKQKQYEALFGGPISKQEKIRAYISGKQMIGMQGGGLSGVAPGFSKLMATEAAIAEGAIAGSTARSVKHITGMTGVIRESMVILREIMMGRGAGRIMGSITLLEQYIATMAKVSAASLAVWAAAAAVAIGTVYMRFKGTKDLIKELSFDVSKIDVGDEYVTKMHRHLSDAANLQRALNDEIRKTTEQYNSAAEAAKRLDDVTNEHFNHLREMNQLSNASESAKANRQLEIDKEERAQKIANKRIEQAKLLEEAEAKQAEIKAKYSGVNTKEEDEKNQRQLDARAEAAKKFLGGNSVWEEFLKRAAVFSSIAGKADITGASAVRNLINPDSESSVTSEDLEMIEAGGQGLAQHFIDYANTHRDKIDQNDILRGQKKEAEDAYKKAKNAAAEIGLDLPNMESLAAQKNADEAEKLRAQMIRGGGGGGRSTTERERLGIGAPQVANLQKQTLDVSKMQLSEMQKFNANINKLIASGNGANNPDGW